MGNKKGKKWKRWQILFSLVLESLWTVTLAMKLKDFLLGRKAMTNLDSILKSRDNTLPTKVCIVKAVRAAVHGAERVRQDWAAEISWTELMVFRVAVYKCESWIIKKAECWRIDAFELWCRRRLESPLDYKEIKLVNPKGNQPWMFIGRTDAEAEAPILWPPVGKSQLLGKDSDAGKIWRQREKRAAEDEVAR